MQTIQRNVCSSLTYYAMLTLWMQMNWKILKDAKLKRCINQSGHMTWVDSKRAVSHNSFHFSYITDLTCGSNHSRLVHQFANLSLVLYHCIIQ